MTADVALPAAVLDSDDDFDYAEVDVLRCAV